MAVETQMRLESEPRHCGQKVPEALENLNKQLALLQFQLENSDISGVSCKEATRRTTFHVLFLQEKATKCLVFSIDSLLCLETETLLLALLNSSRYSIVGGREHIDKVQDSKSQRCALNTGFKLQHHTHKSTSKYL